MRRAPDSVFGHRIAEPRVTGLGIAMLVWRLGLPVLALLLLFDLAVWAVVRALTGACFALWCWF